jgi:hypothetical protein
MIPTPAIGPSQLISCSQLKIHPQTAKAAVEPTSKRSIALRITCGLRDI